jgi:riboflavin transporter FmnP
MFEWLTLHVASLVLTALLFGTMAALMGLFTRWVFKFLKGDAAGEFLGKVFPSYYRTGTVIAILAAAPLLPGQSYGVEIGVLLGVAAAFILSVRFLLPLMGRAKEAGDKKRFAALHGISQALHLTQFAGVAVVLVRLAQ